MSSITLMIQGTASDAGKSVLVAGICRALKRRGVSVAPFKPQNMALNSAVTIDGGEIGRAQALQAMACGIPAHTDMNPILLKPSSDTGAQVVIHGKAISSMEACAFHDYKKVAMDAVLESYHRLQQQYDFIIVEGAGSPAEINLRENDIANMGFAEAVDCPVILIADIDKGGVFAHIVGTLELLSASEQKRILGYVINRFRGDIKLLESGLEWLEKKTQKRVFGVIPYLNNFFLDSEDAIVLQSSKKAIGSLRVAVPVFSRISNHTDFDALQLHPHVDLLFVAPGSAIPEADLIILPGTKNVRKDLALVFEYHWDVAIKKHLRYGGKLIGICGGYQMLGKFISDPDGIEDIAGISPGLSLLNITTVLENKKRVAEVEGLLLLNEKDAAISGYEIHCGESTLHNDYEPVITVQGGEVIGIKDDDDAIIGTYLHGLFDSADATNELLSWAGLEKKHAINIETIREKQLNRLADCLDDSLGDTFFQNFILNKFELESE